MRYVYLLQSETAGSQRYVGVTSDLKARIADHDAGKSPTAPNVLLGNW
jgi:predicted GIY-YIG superfamily endonuclease